MAQYDFHYLPLEGKITGKQVLQQTQDAINDLGNRIVDIETDTEAITEAVEIAQDAKNTADNAETIANDAMDVAQAERESAQEAAQEANQAATNAANSASSASVTAQQLMEYLATKEEITAPAVDPTLTISGAAADAQVTGDNISALNKNIQSLHAVAISGDLNNKTAGTIQGLSVEVDGCVIRLNGTVSGTTGSVRVYSLQENPPKGYSNAANFFSGCTISNTLLAGHTYRMHAVLVGGTFTSGSNTYSAGLVFGQSNTSLFLSTYADGHNTTPAVLNGDGAEVTPETDMVVGALNFRSTGTRVFNNAVIVAYLEDVTLTSKLNTTDKTLSVAGLPADAKEVGNVINKIDTKLASVSKTITGYPAYIADAISSTPNITTNADRIMRISTNIASIQEGEYNNKHGVHISSYDGVVTFSGTEIDNAHRDFSNAFNLDGGVTYVIAGGPAIDGDAGYMTLKHDTDYLVRAYGNDVYTYTPDANITATIGFRYIGGVDYTGVSFAPFICKQEDYAETPSDSVTLLDGANTLYNANMDTIEVTYVYDVQEYIQNLVVEEETLEKAFEKYKQNDVYNETFSTYFATDSSVPQYISMWTQYTQEDGVTDVPTIQFQLVNSSDNALYTSPNYNLGSAYEPLMQEWRVPPILGIYNRYKITVTIPEGVTLNIKNIVSHESASARYFDNGIRYCWHGNGYAPSNTDIAFKMGGLLGFHKCVTIPKYTSDEIGICYHDETTTANTNSTRDKNGARIVADSEDDKSINKFTYAEILEKFDVGYSKSGVEYKGMVIPTLDEFFRICSLTGMEPVLSVHNNSGFYTQSSGNYACTREQALTRWQNIKDLATKWNVRDKLWIKGGSDIQRFARTTFEHEIAGYILLQGIGSSWDMLDQAKYLGFVGNDATSITESTYTVRAEFFNTAPNLEDKIEQAVAEGFPINIASDTTINGEDMTYLIGLGVTEFTLDRHCSIGLCW